MDYPSICPRCKNKDLCAEGFLCPAVDLLASNESRSSKEQLFKIGDRNEYKDYKEVLAENQNFLDRCEELKGPNPRQYLIIKAFYDFKMTIAEISRAFKVSERTITRLKNSKYPDCHPPVSFDNHHKYR